NQMEPLDLRIFVGGITLETTKEMLMDHFSQFGNITNAEVVYEKKTSKWPQLAQNSTINHFFWK
ncbi:MAG: hypothetical protein AAF242_21555, partial [Bacteroidota bacterium]